MAAAYGEPRFLLGALLSPAMVLGNHMAERGRTKRRREREESKAAGKARKADAAARTAVVEQRWRARAAAPDPATALLTLAGPGRRLWERRSDDEDHLLLRVGLGTRPANVDLRGETDQRVPDLNDVPIGLPLERLGAIGLAGPRPSTRAAARNMVLQVIALHSPDDVRLVVLTDPGSHADWGWVGWAPHGVLTDGGEVVAIGNSVDTVEARLKDLSGALASRRNAVATGSGAIEVPLPRIVVVLDGARQLRSRPGAANLLSQGPEVGIYTICLDDAENLLPEECRGTVVFDPSSGDLPSVTATVSQTGHAPVRQVLVDQVAPSLLELGARRIAPIRRISGADVAGGLPSSVGLLDLLGLDPPDPGLIAARWRTSRDPAAAIGRTVDGVATIDLATDGPHGVVGGMTGSGKSELLLALIASLACSNRPDELTFVLVDYKGGATFGPCAALPHCVGFVTNLEGHLTRRVQQSLKAEVERRQRLFSELGANKLSEYQVAVARLGPEGAHRAVPRLLVVFDEFSELVAEAPDFLDALLKIARTGRSLGVHMILATQRPHGVVTPEIRANSNLRIALRVADAGDSDDVVDRPDAVTISGAFPGRAYVKAGSDRFELVQTAFAGAARPAAERQVVAPRVLVRGWDQIGLPPPRHGATPKVDDDAEKPPTDLDVLVAALGEAWDETAPDATLWRPWLEPLPAVVTLDALAVTDDDPTPLVPYGLEDVPSEQRQGVTTWDLRKGHLAVIGTGRSGRSTLLRTLAVSAARTLGADRVNLSVFDCGGGSLSRLAASPLTGAVVSSAEPGRAVRLIERLVERVAERQHQRSAEAWRSIEEQWASSRRDQHLPYEVVLVDRYEGFRDAFGETADGAAVSGLRHLLDVGPSVGIVVAVSGETDLLSPRVVGSVRQRLVLPMADRSAYGDAGIPAVQVPADVVPGQAFRPRLDAEIRIAVLAEDLSGPAQDAALAAALADLGRDRRGGSFDPIRVDVLPARIGLSAATALGPGPTGAFPVLLGVGGDDLAAQWVDLGPTSGAAVIGPREMGRSTALASLASSAVDQGAAVVLVGPLDGPLAQVTGRAGVLAHVERIDDDAVLRALADHDGRLLVVLDDATSLRGTTDAVDDAARSGRPDRRIAFGATADEVDGVYSGFVSVVLKRAAVVLLSPKGHHEARSLGVDIARGSEFSGPRGRAYLAVAGGPPRLVQMPTPDV
jgi:S-DNA-T family DNA segregation ATPase FtsK/SpoIIIE